MLRSIPLPGCDLRLSRFVCVSLANADRGFARANLLAAVADAGPTHFDVAPSYGFVMAEPGLTPILKARPTLKVAGKFFGARKPASGLSASRRRDLASPGSPSPIRRTRR